MYLASGGFRTKHEKTWNLNVDVTYARIVVTP